jgi:hypothetical protein
MPISTAAPYCYPVAGYMVYYYDYREDDGDNGGTMSPTASSESAAGKGGGGAAATTNLIIKAAMREIVRRGIISMTVNDGDGINVVTPMQKTWQRQRLPAGNMARGTIHECEIDDVCRDMGLTIYGI